LVFGGDITNLREVKDLMTLARLSIRLYLPATPAPSLRVVAFEADSTSKCNTEGIG